MNIELRASDWNTNKNNVTHIWFFPNITDNVVLEIDFDNRKVKKILKD